VSVHCTVDSAMCRSFWIDGIATVTIATSRIVMKNAAPTTASVSQRRRFRAASVIGLLRSALSWANEYADEPIPATFAGPRRAVSGRGAEWPDSVATTDLLQAQIDELAAAFKGLEEGGGDPRR